VKKVKKFSNCRRKQKVEMDATASDAVKDKNDANVGANVDAKIVEAILRETRYTSFRESYPSFRERRLSLYPPDLLSPQRRKLSSPPPPMIVRNFESGSRRPAAASTLPRLPGIGHLITTDKTEVGARPRPEVAADAPHERSEADTDGSIPDLTEIFPPPRRKKMRHQPIGRKAVLAAAETASEANVEANVEAAAAVAVEDTKDNVAVTAEAAFDGLSEALGREVLCRLNSGSRSHKRWARPFLGLEL
jgi:hypothetical protein